MKYYQTYIIFLFSTIIFAQRGDEVDPPYHIKTISFVTNGNNVIPFFKLGEPFQLEFDDLYSDEADYFYTITHYDYDWSKPSDLSKAEYLNGVDNQRFINYENSFNNLQLYSHFRQIFPNNFNQITKSGNYLFTVYNDQNEVVFSRRVIIYENDVNVGLLIRRSRDFQGLDSMQNIEMSINYGNRILQNPIQNVNVTLFQNGNWKSSINNIRPQFTLGSELIYRYNKETQFWGGNEYYSIDTKIIRATNNTVARVTSGNEIYNTFLYVNSPRKNQPYTYFPDINGNFFTQNANATNSRVEADYSWIYFALDVAELPNKKIYIQGMFNNYAYADEFKMEYNSKSKLYEKAILIKQGFTNFKYVVTDNKGNVDYANAIDGNFFQTENNYTAIVYYRGNNDRFHRVIGIANTNSEVIQN